jgi:hypothetical protein
VKLTVSQNEAYVTMQALDWALASGVLVGSANRGTVRSVITLLEKAMIETTKENEYYDKGFKHE